jgi:hypothetical protein
MTDPLWDAYAEAVYDLGQLPHSRDKRRAAASKAEKDAVTQARRARDAEIERTEEWQMLAGRAANTAEARLVSEQVTVPDTTSAPMPGGPPAELAALLAQTERELVTDIRGLAGARVRAREAAIRRARRAKELAERRRAILKFAAIGAAVVVALIVISVLTG